MLLSQVIAVLLAHPLSEPCPATVGSTPRISMWVGSPKVISVADDATFKLSPPEPVDIKLIKKPGPGRGAALLLVGVKEGDAVLTVESDGGVSRWNVNVEAADIDAELGIKTLFPCGTTMRWKFVKERVQLFGTASSLDEWMAVARAQREVPTLIVSGSLDPAVIAWTIGEANVALTREGLTGLHFVRDGDAVLLEGEVPDGREKAFAKVEAEWREKLTAAFWKPKNRK